MPNGTVIAERNHTEVVEGNHYLPPDYVDGGCLRENQTHTRRSWNGKASPYGLMADGDFIEDAA